MSNSTTPYVLTGGGFVSSTGAAVAFGTLQLTLSAPAWDPSLTILICNGYTVSYPLDQSGYVAQFPPPYIWPVDQLTNAYLYGGGLYYMMSCFAADGQLIWGPNAVRPVSAQSLLYVTSQQVSGTIDGSNVGFTISAAPNNGSLMLFYNGVALTPGVSADYTTSFLTTGLAITLTVPPMPGDVVSAVYDYNSLLAPTWFQEIPSGVLTGTTFTLTNTPISASAVLVYVNGLLQPFTISGNVITLSTAPGTGSNLYAVYKTGLGSVGAMAETPGGSCTGANATFTLSQAAVPNSLLLYRNGVYQSPLLDYTLSTSTISMTVPPSLGDVMYAVYDSGNNTIPLATIYPINPS